MRFMMLMIPQAYRTDVPPDFVPDPAAVAEMEKFNEEMQKAGILLSLDGLQPPVNGARVSFVSGKPVVMDGPFTETKEVLGGYWMINVASREEAIAWAVRCPATKGDVIEIRKVFEPEDFAPPAA